jgi:hypothetical protein
MATQAAKPNPSLEETPDRKENRDEIMYFFLPTLPATLERAQTPAQKTLTALRLGEFVIGRLSE